MSRTVAATTKASPRMAAVNAARTSAFGRTAGTALRMGRRLSVSDAESIT